MCGIAGFLGWEGERSEEVLLAAGRRMADMLRHRGPDADGVWCDTNHGLALSHRRLAIIDLTETGRQPMISGSGRFIIVFNGEIYNFADLRKQLEQQGVRFRGRSDTEVLLEGAELWGVNEVIRRSVGMFALALWDRGEKRLHLYRDRMGEKPLYYGYCGRLFVFCSELKALRVLPEAPSNLSRPALALYLRYGFIPAPHSIYEGIYKLPPGHALTVDAAEVDGQARIIPQAVGQASHLSRPHPYWSLSEEGEPSPSTKHKTAAELVEDLDAALRLAVRRQMVADVPVGAFLSGGIDSTTVVALMQKISTRPVRTFSVSFGEDEFNEAPFARRIAEHLGTEHVEAALSPDEAIRVIPQLPNIYDEPFADPSQIPTFLISRVARQYVTVCLSGDGGDEIFGGYNRYFWTRNIWRWARWQPRLFRQLVSKGILAVGNATWDRLNGLCAGKWYQADLGSKLQKLGLALRHDSIWRMYRSLLACWEDPGLFLGPVSEPKTVMDGVGQSGHSDPIMTFLFWDSVFYLPDDNLTRVDRASMAVSLEMRVPLLDHTIAEQVWRMPDRLRTEAHKSKWLLRQVLYRYVPPQLIERPKKGFSVPLAEWLRGPLRSWAEDLLFSGGSDSDGLIRTAEVRKRWREHIEGRRDWNLVLWALICLRAWQADVRR